MVFFCGWRREKRVFSVFFLCFFPPASTVDNVDPNETPQGLHSLFLIKAMFGSTRELFCLPLAINHGQYIYIKQPKRIQYKFGLGIRAILIGVLIIAAAKKKNFSKYIEMHSEWVH